jgi:hypothetical protein
MQSLVGLTGHDAPAVRTVAVSAPGLGFPPDELRASECGLGEAVDAWHDRHFASYHWLIVSALRWGSWQVTQPRDPSLSV